MVNAHVRIAVFALLAAALSACASSPPTRFLTLDPVSAPTPAGVALYGGPAVRVRRVHVPAALDRAEVASEPRVGVISVDAFAHWAAPLGALARDALHGTWSATVVADPGSAGKDHDDTLTFTKGDQVSSAWLAVAPAG